MCVQRWVAAHPPIVVDRIDHDSDGLTRGNAISILVNTLALGSTQIPFSNCLDTYLCAIDFNMRPTCWN